MLEQLMQLIQQHGQQSVVENSAVPNEHNEAVMQEAQSSITSGLQQMASGGGLEQLTQMLQSGQAPDASHPAVQQISGNFAQNIAQKFGINGQEAGNIASSLIPNVLGKIFNQQQGQQGGFDIGNILQSLTGSGVTSSGTASSGGGIMDQISNIGSKLGLDKDGDGDVDLNDITKMFKG